MRLSRFRRTRPLSGGRNPENVQAFIAQRLARHLARQIETHCFDFLTRSMAAQQDLPLKSNERRVSSEKMAHHFKVVPRTVIGPSAWDRFAQESSEAWLFHTSRWQAVAGAGKDRSFGLVNGSGILRALITLHSEPIPKIRLLSL